MVRTAAGRKGRRRGPVLEVLEDRRLLAVSLAFDYSLDDAGFFTAERRGLFESTLRGIASRLDDTLAPVPQASYTLPVSTGDRTVEATSPADVVTVFAYGDKISSIALGGAYFTYTTDDAMRGQGPNDYAPDLAYLAFNVGSNWFFGETTEGLAQSGGVDFVTVARHEFLHSLGFLSRQPTFARQVQDGVFHGANAREANGGEAVPINGSHVASQVRSLMNPATSSGRRTDLTDLEWGFLRDFGWQVTYPSSTLHREIDLFTGGQGDGVAKVQVVPSQGVHLMRLDVLAGDTVRLRTYDGSTPFERGVDSYLRLFDEFGREILRSNDTSSSPGKEDVVYTFTTGGRYWVGAGSYAQRNYTITTPSTSPAPSGAFYLDVTLTSRPKPSRQVSGGPSTVDLSRGSFSIETTLAGAEVDVYWFNARPGATYVVTTSLPAAGGLAGPTIASLYNASGRKVAGMNGATNHGRFEFTVYTGGLHFVRVARTAGAEVVDLDEPVAGSSFRIVDASRGFTIEGERGYGLDYKLAIVENVPAPLVSREPVFLDFGVHGLWRWTEAGGFHQLNAAPPENIAAAPDGSLFVDYGRFGTWRWSESQGFSLLNAADPEGMTVGPDGALYLDYGGFGLWRWSETTSIQQLCPADPQGFTAGGAGELFVDYGQFGLWRWTAPKGLHILSAADPQGMAYGAGTLFVDYGGFGLWRWTATDGFARIAESDPGAMAVGTDGTLYVGFGVGGLRAWRQGVFYDLHPDDAQSLAAAVDGWLYIDFGSEGVWRWSLGDGFKRLNPADARGIAVAPPNRLV